MPPGSGDQAPGGVFHSVETEAVSLELGLTQVFSLSPPKCTEQVWWP